MLRTHRLHCEGPSVGTTVSPLGVLRRATSVHGRVQVGRRFPARSGAVIRDAGTRSSIHANGGIEGSSTSTVVSSGCPRLWFSVRVLRRVQYFYAQQLPYGKAMLESMTAIVPGKFQGGNLRKKLEEATRPTTYGVLKTRSREEEDVYKAVLLRYDGCDFWLADMALSVTTGISFLYWEAHGSLLSHGRRCAVLENSQDIPMTKKLAERDTSIDSSSHRLVKNGRWYKQVQSELDEAQLYAFDYTVLRRGLTPIRGSFGCGKTRLIASMVAVMNEAFPRSRIFVTSETNSAIDEDLQRVVDEGRVPTNRILRLGDMPARTPEKYRRYYYHERAEMECHEVYAKAKNAYDRLQVSAYIRQLKQRLLVNAMVVFATVSTLGREDYRHLSASVVVVDDDAQTSEAAMVQALRPSTHTSIPISDPFQKDSYIELPEHQRVRYAPGDRRHKVSWSIIHAFQNEFEVFPGLTLTAQYRSHEQIGRWLAGYYDYELVQKGRCTPDYLSTLIVVDSKTMQSSRIAMVSCINAEREDHRPFQDTNEVETWKVLELVLLTVCERTRQVDQGLMTLIVITPYEEQLKRLQGVIDACSQLWMKHLEIKVATIDSSQGQEADVAIVSMVRVQGLGFLAEDRARALVALSRGRDYLVVLAKESVFEDDPCWQPLYNQARRRTSRK